MPVSKIRIRECQWCGEMYELGVDTNQHKYCSKKCRSKWHYNKWKSSGGKRCPRKQKEYWLKNKYGINLLEYENLLASQNNRCKICNTSEPTGYNWHVDHNHITGCVRGILCSRCNQALGLVDENIKTLLGMVAYLEEEGK